MFKRRFGKGSVIGLSLLLVVIAATAGAVRPSAGFAAAAGTDTCGYNPAAAPNPAGGTVIFDENTVTRAIGFFGTGLSGHVGVFANDESGLYIGSGGTPSSVVSGQVYGEAIPPTFGAGNDAVGRPSAPTIYLTDITGNAAATGGDWEMGGQPATTGADGLEGAWTPTIGTKPVSKDGWNLGPDADAVPATDAFGGTTTAFNEGYGTEVQWSVAGLKAFDPTTSTFVAVQPGHTYRVQSMTHDGDQNHTSGGGDVGEVCTTFSVPGTASIQVLKTADAAQVNAGQAIGFTVTVSNAGGADATGVTLSDPLPTNAGLSWAIDNQGAGWGGTCAIAAGTLTCGGVNGVTVPAATTPAASTFTVHITSPTTAATGGACPNSGNVDNTATVNSTNGGTGQSSASTCVNVGTFPPPCTAVSVHEKQFYVGRVTKVHMTVTQAHKAVKGVRVLIKGPRFRVTSGKSNAKGKIVQRIFPKKAGVITFKPIVKTGTACKVPRVGVTGVFTPPVTG